LAGVSTATFNEFFFWQVHSQHTDLVISYNLTVKCLNANHHYWIYLTCISGRWSIREVITTFWDGLLYCTCNPM